MELFRGDIFKMIENALEDFLQVLRSIASFPADIASAWCGIQFDSRDTGSVLAPVSHFLQQHLEGMDPVERGTILFLVIIERLKQPDECYATLMFDLITHWRVQKYGFPAPIRGRILTLRQFRIKLA